MIPRTHRISFLISASLLTALLSAPVRSDVVYYTTKRGDRLEEIASRYRISLSRIIKDNNIRNPDHLFAGLRLKIELPPGSVPVEGSQGVALPQNPSRPGVASPREATKPTVNTPTVMPSEAASPANSPAPSPGGEPAQKTAAPRSSLDTPAPSSGARQKTGAPAQRPSNAVPRDYDELQRQQAEVPGGGASLTRILGSLAVICLLIVGAVWVLKQMHLRRWPTWLPQKSPPGSMRLVETLYLFPTRSVALHLVEVAGRMLLLGTTSNHVQLLTEIQDKEAIETAKEMAQQTFDTALKDMGAGYEAARRDEEWQRPTEDVRKDFQTATQELLRTIETFKKRKEPQDGSTNSSDQV